MKPSRWWWWWVLLGLSGLPAIALAAWKPPLARVIVVEGRVEVKRIGHSQYHRVQPDEPLYLGDLIKVARGGRSVIRCVSDATIWTIPADGLPRGVANTCLPPP